MVLFCSFFLIKLIQTFFFYLFFFFKSVNSVQQLTERVRRGSTDTLHHHCPPQDHRSVQVKKTMTEKLKRKDYELKTLKTELKTKNDELSMLTNRVTIAEKSQLKN